MEKNAIGEIPSHGNHTGTSVTGGNYLGFLNVNAFTAYGSSGRGWDVRAGNEMHPAGQYLGSDTPHNNLAPYLTVYVWIRRS